MSLMLPESQPKPHKPNIYVENVGPAAYSVLDVQSPEGNEDRDQQKSSPDKKTTEDRSANQRADPSGHRRVDLNSVYNEKSRPGYDDYGKELGKNARVWKTYVQEASRWDADLVDGWNRSLDLILIFAALFSAISTAFVIESSKALQPDYTESTYRSLTFLSATLVAIANKEPGAALNITAPEEDEFSAPISAICVNALWYLSLSLSVGVSLIAMLAKDWSRSYVAELTGQPYQQARKRQTRWNGLKEWRIPEVITFLPILLHLALLLFAVGLTVYLWNIHIGASIPVLIVAVGACLAYAVATVLPLLYENCPYSTPASQIITMLPKPAISTWFSHWNAPRSDYESIPLAETANQDQDEELLDDLTSRALVWLIANYEDTKSVDIALQAISGTHTKLPIEPLLDSGAFLLLEQRLQTCLAFRPLTGKFYLKDSTLLEDALLYSRALTIPRDRPEGCFNFLNVVWPWPTNLVENSSEKVYLASINSETSWSGFSPNKIAFALASLATGSMSIKDKSMTRMIKPLEPTPVILTTRLLQLHVQDKITLDPPALLALLRAAAFWPSFDIQDEDSGDLLNLMMTLVHFLLTLDQEANSLTHGWIGVALTTFVCAHHDYSQWPRPSPLPRRNRAGRDAVIALLYDRYPKSILKDIHSLLTFGLLELTKHYAERLSEDDQIALIQIFRHCQSRSPVIDIYFLDQPAFGADYQHILDSVVPFLRPDGQGSYSHSELLRAIRLAVFDNKEFHQKCLKSPLAHILALENLASARAGYLKNTSCAVLGWMVTLRTEHLNDIHFHQNQTRLCLQLLGCEDERVIPYAMKTLADLSSLVSFWSRWSLAEKNEILEPLVTYPDFARVQETRGLANHLPIGSHDTSFLDMWILRLEDMVRRIPLHVYESRIAHSLRGTIDIHEPTHPLKDRIIAVMEQSRLASEEGPADWS